MGKFKSWKHRGLFIDIASSVCLIGASAGLIFGVSAGTFKVNYTDLNNAETRVAAANGTYNYYSQNIKSEWNMSKDVRPQTQEIDEAWWNKMHNNAPMLITDADRKTMEIDTAYGSDISDNAIKARYNYISMVIDGATHSTMDRSFNQGLYNGVVNFIQNKNILSSELSPETENDPLKNCAKSFKPGADNTTEFINIFNTVAKTYRVVGLAGFNHVTPLNALGTYNEQTKRVDFTNPDIDKTAFLLIDGDVSNNQNVGSVLFRADEPGFMAAIATCMYFINNLPIYHDAHQDLAIGIYGGTAIPTVTSYMGGAQRGIEFFNEVILKAGLINFDLHGVLRQKWSWVDFADAKKLYEATKYKEEADKLLAKPEAEITDEEWKQFADKIYKEFEIKQIKLGNSGTHFSGTFNAGDAIGITKQYLNRGAGAIMAVAGPQSLDTAQEIQNQNSKCIVIGVDSAMEEGDYQRKFNGTYTDTNVAPDNSTPAQKDNIIKFSAVKDMTTVTQKFAGLAAANLNFDVGTEEDPNIPDPEKAICNIGYKTCGNIRNGLISISWDGMYPFFQAMLHIPYIYDSEGHPLDNFESFWYIAAHEYIEKHATEIKDQEFIKKIPYVRNLFTYDKNAWDGQLYKNYSHVMSILGEFMKKACFYVAPKMTVEAEKDAEGNIQYVQPKEAKYMSILDWLQTNMYFSN